MGSSTAGFSAAVALHKLLHCTLKMLLSFACFMFAWKVFFCLLLANYLFFQGKRIASVNCSAMEANHFFPFWIFCSWCLTDMFHRGSPSSKLISARFELTSVKCLSYFYLDLIWLSTCHTSLEMKRLHFVPVLVVHILSVVCFQCDVLSFSKRNVLDFEHQSFVGFSQNHSIHVS